MANLTGTTGADEIIGTENADYIRAEAGNDRLVGGGGADLLEDGPGQDIVEAGAGDDTIYAGIDTSADFYAGGDGNDTLRISLEHFERGRFTVNDASGWMRYSAPGAATDSFSSFESYRVTGQINVLFQGGAGATSIETAEGQDRIYGEGGDDVISSSLGHDFVIGGEGDDIIDLGAGNDRSYAGPGDAGDDQVFGGAGDDIIGGGAGNDTLDGGTGFDLIFGGAGDDTIGDEGLSRGHDGEGCIVWAGSGHDAIYATGDKATLGGGDGDDTIQSRASGDIVYGGDGNDDILLDQARSYLFSQDDVVFSGAGNDVISTRYGDDTIFNGTGSDSVDGGIGEDTLWGGAGDDILTGNSNDDTFAFAKGNGFDTVTDFEIDAYGGDRLDLRAFGIDDERDAIGHMVETEAGVTLLLGDTVVALNGGDLDIGDFQALDGWLVA